MIKIYKYLFLLCIGFQAFAYDEKPELYVYTWFEFLPSHVIKQFRQETGIEVVVDYYESNQILEAQLLTKNAGYDLVFPSAWPYLERQIQNNLYRKLDKTKLPNFKHLDPMIMNILVKADPNNEHAIPYFWGVTGIGYNIEAVKKIMPDVQIESWAVFFDPKIVSKFAQCGVYLVDEPVDVFSAALVYLGLPPGSDKPQDINRAIETIMKVRPYIRRFDTSRAISDLANGEACLIQNWSGDIAVASRRARDAKSGVEVGFAVPKEGTSIWIDVVAMPIDAPHPNNAHRFLNFLMRPDVIASITNEIEFANANLSAKKHLRQEILNDPAVYPGRKIVEKTYISTVTSRAHEKLLNRSMMKIKTGV